MIQEIFPHTLSCDFKRNIKLKGNDYIFHFQNKGILLKQTNNKIKLPRKKDFKNVNTDYTFLFTLNNNNCFLIWDELLPCEPNMDYFELNSEIIKSCKTIDWASALSYQLMTWYVNHKYCGICGSQTKPKEDERAITCNACSSIIYPNISPAIIVGIISNDKILLARGVNFKNNMYSLIAGYVDVGESIEDTVKREVKEEVGLDVSNIRYYKSQPWPQSSSMMIAFLADGDETQTIKIDTNEIIDAAWFTRDNLPNHPTDRSIAGEIINKFIKNEL